jgi:hypothetical protein
MTLSELFHPAVAKWFADHFAGPTPAQAESWRAIKAGHHTLIAAPTGSGKTLAAFLNAIDDLVRQGIEGPVVDATQVVYVSPLKALSNDIHRNLEAPLPGIRKELQRSGCLMSKFASGSAPATPPRRNVSACAAGRRIFWSRRRNRSTFCLGRSPAGKCWRRLGRSLWTRSMPWRQTNAAPT